MNKHYGNIGLRDSTIQVIAHINSTLPPVLRDRFLFSLARQTFTSFQLTLIAGDIDTSDLAPAIRKFDWDQCLAPPRIIETGHPLAAAQAERQVIARNDCRYLAVADVFGTLYSRAYHVLMEEAVRSRATVVYGDVTSQRLHVLERHTYETHRHHQAFDAPEAVSLRTSGAPPLGACLFDRQRIRSSDLHLICQDGIASLLTKYPIAQVTERVPLYAINALNADPVGFGIPAIGKNSSFDRALKKLRMIRQRIELSASHRFRR